MKTVNMRFGSGFHSFCEQIRTVLSNFSGEILVFVETYSENEKVETCSFSTVPVRASDSPIAFENGPIEVQVSISVFVK